MNRLLSCVVVSLLIGGCGSLPENEEGDIAAKKTGALTAELAKRGPADAAFASCGDGAPTSRGAAVLERSPFLQEVTSTGATVVFRIPPTQPVELEVTTLTGTTAGTVELTTDSSVKGGSQMLARIDGLEPATNHCYSLRGLTEKAGFRTAPSRGSGEPVRFAALGDSGYGGADQRALLAQMSDVPLDLVVHTGDIAYDRGTAAQLERTVFQPYGGLMRHFPIYPVAGNHDYETAAAAPFLEAFVLPENGDHERWYSFDWGDAHFVALDTERIGEAQASWLQRDLAENRRPWTIVYAHRPPYSSGEHGSSDDFRRYFVPILEDYRVPLVLSGHDHDYERSQVMNGVTYVVTGGGGRGTRPVGTSSFTAFSEAVIHFVFVEIQGSRLVLHAIDGTGREFDQAVIELSQG